MVVRAPCREVELIDTGVVPVLTDKSLIGRKLLKVPKLTHVSTGTAVFYSDVRATLRTRNYKSVVKLIEESLIFSSRIEFGLAVRVVWLHVKVAHTRRHSHH